MGGSARPPRMTRLARAPAKIVPPVAAGLVRRPRLFRLLDRGARTVWLGGPPGSGKTALAATYIDARRRVSGWYQLDERDADLATFFYYLGLLARQIGPAHRTSLPAFTAAFRGGASAFARRFFESLFQRCPRPLVFVLDDYDALPVTAPLHDVLPDLLAAVPTGCRVLITSREDPPPSVARFRSAKVLGTVGWDDLRFTSGEIHLLARGRSGARRATADIDMIARQSQGWAAGAALLLDAVAMNRGMAPRDDLGRPQVVFDYFMAEVLAMLAPADRHALLTLSLLPTVTASSAVELTEYPSAPELLARLSGRHCFVEQRDAGEVVYRFHPMFHQFLRAQATTVLSEDERRRVLRAGATHLIDGGQVDEGADLLLGAHEWKLLERLVIEHAPGLVRAGRGHVVFGWLERMPREVVAASPWLSYWLGETGLSRDFAFAREQLARAAAGFEAIADGNGLAAALAAILESFFLESDAYAPMDPWLDRAAALVEACREGDGALAPPLAISLFRALVYRRPDHPLFPALRDRLHVIRGEARVAEHAVAAGLALGYYYAWAGEPLTAGPIVQIAREVARATHDVVTLQSADYVEGVVAIKLGDGELCEGAVTQGLERAATTGMHALDFRLQALGVYAARMRRDPSRIARRLSWLRDHLEGTRLVDRSQYHFLLGWDQAARGDVDRAYREARTALVLAEEAGVPLQITLPTFLLAQLAHERGDTEEAQTHLARMRGIGEAMQSQSMRFMAEMVEADHAYARGDEVEGTRLLRAGFERARRQRLLFYAGWRPSLMTRLCVAALERDICVDYVQEMIRHHALVPDRAPLDVSNWPWAVEIRALGALRVHRGDGELRATGKAPHRPLELLRALLAFGGRHVPAQRLIDTLWPDAEGDLGQQALDTNLLRLRRFLQCDEAVVVEHGRVSLDEGLCWVDVWTLERHLERIERLLSGDAKLAAVARPAEEALRLYAGSFLADSDHGWAVAPRERVRRRLLGVVERIGQAREHAGDAEWALASYLGGLHVDDLAEGLYRAAMRCYVALGRHAEAVALYERCRRVLAAQLGVAPSPATHAVVAALSDATSLRARTP